VLYWVKKNWNVKLSFEFVQTVDKDYDLYLLRTEKLPVEFVIKLKSKDGSVYYDNNGGYGLNYKLVPFQGRWTSAHAGIGHLQIYPNFVHCQIIPHK